MKSLVLLSLCFGTLSFAAEVLPQGGALESCMKTMNQNLKLISRQVQDSTLNQKTAQLAEQLAQATTQCKRNLPGGINNLPPNERDVRKALYEEMMDNTAELSDQLAVTLRKNDNLKAQKLVQNLLALKKDGHEEFKNADLTISAYDLKSIMKQMGTNLKLIATRINDPSQNSNSAKLADDLTQATLDSKNHMPGSITSLPASEQAARKKAYDQMLDDSAALSQQLASALRANDNAKAKAIIDQLGNLKKESHFEFK